MYFASACSMVNGALLVPELRRLAERLAADLGVMARPLLEAHQRGEDPGARVKHWLDWLATISSKKSGAEALTSAQLRLLTDGKRKNRIVSSRVYCCGVC